MPVQCAEECSVWAATYVGECICSARDLGSFVLGMISIVAWALAVVPQASTRTRPRLSPFPNPLSQPASSVRARRVFGMDTHRRRPASPGRRRKPSTLATTGFRGGVGVGVAVADSHACVASHGAP